MGRREVHSAPALVGLSSDSERDDEDGAVHRDADGREDDSSNNASTDSSHGEDDACGSEEAPYWEPAKVSGRHFFTKSFWSILLYSLFMS